ncbi:substrate-binding domain-containing protein [Pseudooceanicola sp. CBS1P-1]|uniref:Substrate-binding domain-containing protein n=1 Tax=Pseudooceanicola albus TaxID=2692189 RepID=A0A6L7G6L7_9RHOB|nr:MULTISPECIES: substrate-binding domain-containing protein [Pseudooceanicola]MBT9384318.1 substrate-binding domain-containing protein [Pseudooceanicola endophyticus]MXN19944.1 substrate-binding domain-containing protein [Pseudooceanicola albus]
MTSIRRTGLALGCATAALLALGPVQGRALDLAPDKVGTEAEFQDIKQFCGTKPIRVALSDGWGGNTWRKTARAEFEDEAAKCPNITQVAYTDAGGNPEQQIQDIQSLTAQGYDVILVSFDFVQSNLRAMQAARRAGASVVLYNTGTTLPAKLGVNYDSRVTLDLEAEGKLWGEWAVKYLHGKGNVLPFGGTPGAQPTLSYREGWQPVFDANPDIKVLQDPVVTNWDPAQYTSATSALLGKYDHIDLLLSDYITGVMGAVRAFQNAGRPLVAVTGVDANEVHCFYEDVKDKEPGFQFLTLSGGTWQTRLALRKGLAHHNGIDDTEPSIIEPTVIADSLSDDPELAPHCDRDLPMDASFGSSYLSREAFKAMLGQ